MKKFLFLLGGAIALTACSEDALQAIDEQQNSDNMNAPSSFNNDQSGHSFGDDHQSGFPFVGDNYASPWDIWYRKNTYGIGNLQPVYIIGNGNAENVTKYDIRVFAYAGLAYFDSFDDGRFHDVSQSPPQLIADMAANPGWYPNLYPATNLHEVGNLVKTAVPFISNAYPDPSHGFRMESTTQHLPMGINNKYPVWPQYFDFAGTITPEEEKLLSEYGKVFFYEVLVYDKGTNNLVFSTMMHPEIETLTQNYNPDWNAVIDTGGNHIQGIVPTLGNFDLYYYYANLPNGTEWTVQEDWDDKCDSREVVFYVSKNLHTIDIPGGNNTLSLSIAQSSYYLWLNSALYLRVY